MTRPEPAGAGTAEMIGLRKRSLAHVTVEDHPYDRGYWRRYAGDPRPLDEGEARDGWDDCNAELASINPPGEDE